MGHQPLERHEVLHLGEVAPDNGQRVRPQARLDRLASGSACAYSRTVRMYLKPNVSSPTSSPADRRRPTRAGRARRYHGRDDGRRAARASGARRRPARQTAAEPASAAERARRAPQAGPEQQQRGPQAEHVADHAVAAAELLQVQLGGVVEERLEAAVAQEQGAPEDGPQAERHHRAADQDAVAGQPASLASGPGLLRQASMNATPNARNPSVASATVLARSDQENPSAISPGRPSADRRAASPAAARTRRPSPARPPPAAR